MKKLVMLLLLSTFLITGCSITTLSNSDIDNNINKLLSDDKYIVITNIMGNLKMFNMMVILIMFLED